MKPNITTILAIIITAISITAISITAPAAHAQTPPAHGPFIIECMMLTGCWFHPTGYPPDYWFWVPIYIDLEPHQYDRVWNTADWRWIPEPAQ